MTGTTVRFGEHLYRQDWRAAMVTGIVLAAFVFGSIAGRVNIEIGSRRRIRSIASVTLAIEAALLAAVVVLGVHAVVGSGWAHTSIGTVCVLLAMLASAMGLQTATLTRVGVLTVHTTFVTGMLNKLAQLVSHLLFRSYDLRLAAGAQKSDLQLERNQISRQAGFLFSIWLCYLGGAVCGSWVTYKWGFYSFLVPDCVLVAAIIAGLIHPFSIEEEREQSER